MGMGGVQIFMRIGYCRVYVAEDFKLFENVVLLQTFKLFENVVLAFPVYKHHVDLMR